MLLAVAILGPLTGCADPNAPPGSGQKEGFGTVAGALIGGAAGLALGRGNGRIIAGALGAGIGGLIGNRIGAALDAQDRAAIIAQEHSALLSQPDQQPVAWTSDHSSASATITLENTRHEQRTVRIVRASDVAAPPPLDAIGARYQARSTTHVYAAPDAHSVSLATLSRGSHIWAVGRVRGENWLLVARGGKSVGYVTASKLGPAASLEPSYAATGTAPGAPVAAKGAQAPTGPAYDLDADNVVRAPADLDALQGNDTSGDKVDTVVASVTCRDLQTTATTNGTTQTTKATACRAPDGAWQLD